MQTALETPPTQSPALVHPEQSADRAGQGGKNLAYSERLDHLRFFAAALIIFHHGVPAFAALINKVPCDWPHVWEILGKLPASALPLKAFILEGHTGVGLFMALSGFLFARISDGKILDYKKFFLNRLLRIYPLYVCITLLAVHTSPGNNGLIAIATSLLCLQNLPSAVAQELLTPHLWTIAVEFQFYLLFPLLFGFFCAKGFRPLILLLAASLALKALFYAQHHTVRDLAYSTLFGRIDTFLVGMMLGFSYSRLKEKLKHPLWVTAATALTVGAVVLFHAKGGFFQTHNKAIWIVWPAVEGLLWGSVIVTYCAASLWIPRTISRTLAFLGTLSFSLYVTHLFLAHQLPRWIVPWIDACLKDPHSKYASLLQPVAAHPEWSSILFVLGVVTPAAIALSCLTYFAIEKPFMDMRVKYTSPPNTGR